MHHHGSRTRASRNKFEFTFPHPIWHMQFLHIPIQESLECHDFQQTRSVDAIGQSQTPWRSTWSWRFCACKWQCWKLQRRRCGCWQFEHWEVRLKLLEFPVVVLKNTWGCLQMLELSFPKIQVTNASILTPISYVIFLNSPLAKLSSSKL